MVCCGLDGFAQLSPSTTVRRWAPAAAILALVVASAVRSGGVVLESRFPQLDSDYARSQDVAAAANKLHAILDPGERFEATAHGRELAWLSQRPSAPGAPVPVQNQQDLAARYAREIVASSHFRARFTLVTAARPRRLRSSSATKPSTQRPIHHLPASAAGAGVRSMNAPAVSHRLAPRPGGAREAEVWVVVAAYNESSRLEGVLEKLCDPSRVVVVVDDGSSDATSAAAAKFPVWRLRHAVNCGQGAALQTGMEFCSRTRSEVPRNV